MVGVKVNLNIIVGKTDKKGKWLPLIIHLQDTVGVMKYLLQYWVSDAQVKACHLEESDLWKTAIFLAAIHDLGKSCSGFQALITSEDSCLADRLEEEGYLLNQRATKEKKVAHSYAGQWILESVFNIPETLAIVVGAHHGSPASDSEINGVENLLEIYPSYFYGKEGDHEQHQLWFSVWEEYVNAACRISGYHSINELPELTVEAQIILSGLLIMADWIASNTLYFPLLSLYDTGENIDYDKRLEEGWNRFHITESWVPEIRRMNQELFTERFHFSANQIQMVMYNIANDVQKPGIFILEAPMGIGKTEAALATAEIIAAKVHAKGIFFGLPTQATCNGLFDRLYDWAETVSENTISSIRLAHGGALLDPDYFSQVMRGQAIVEQDNEASGVLVHPWFQGNKRALLADFVIGTVDQILMAALRKKHFMLRHLGLVGKVIIIDEAHSYSVYTNQYLFKTLEWLGRYEVPVILLSATLPSNVRTELIRSYLGLNVELKKDSSKSKIDNEYPLLSWTDGTNINQKYIQLENDSKSVQISRLHEKQEVIDALGKRLRNGGCASVILNTVNSAQEYYESIKMAFPNWTVLLYHAQFTMENRLEKESILQKKMGKSSQTSDRDHFILVGTQVLEQSLDYDADVMFTQLCPIDLLLQRIGRLHRHNRKGANRQDMRPCEVQTARCYIILDGDRVGGCDMGTTLIYNEYLLMRSLHVLPECINIPDDISRLVQTVYDVEDELGLQKSEEYWRYKEVYLTKESKQIKRARTFLLCKPRDVITNLLTNQCVYDDEDGYRSVRDGDSSIEVILVKKTGNGIGFVDSKDTVSVKEGILPDEKTCYSIARQRIRLPKLFSQSYLVDRVSDILERRQRPFEIWKKSSWLQGENILLLDEHNTTELCGYRIYYDYESGLRCIKEEDEFGERI